MSVTQASLLGDTFGSKASGTIPVGGIIMWSGSIVSIPTGWALCNGANGTPNLVDKFIVGAGSGYAVAATGGSADATLVSHSHTGTTADKNVTGTFNAWNRSFNSFPPTGAFSYSGQNYNPSFAGGGGEANTNRGITMNITHNHDVTITSSGSPATNANLPPYYALAYIMRTS